MLFERGEALGILLLLGAGALLGQALLQGLLPGGEGLVALLDGIGGGTRGGRSHLGHLEPLVVEEGPGGVPLAQQQVDEGAVHIGTADEERLLGARVAAEAGAPLLDDGDGVLEELPGGGHLAGGEALLGTSVLGPPHDLAGA